MDEVHLQDYDSNWPAMYATEAARVRTALPAGLIFGLEHFGSTAIPDMAAKPIIDILVAVRSIEAAREQAVPFMEALGNAFWADNPKRDRLFFVKGLPPAALHRTHHVHMTQTDGEMWQRLLFRDYLRSHPNEAARYLALKRGFAVRHSRDREAYTDAKSVYVEAVMAKALRFSGEG